MSRYNTQVLSNIRMLCRMQNIDEKVLYERAKLILSIYREVCWSTIDRANDVCDTLPDLDVTTSRPVSFLKKSVRSSVSVLLLSMMVLIQIL